MIVPVALDRSDCQVWRIEPANGSHTINQVKTGKALDIPACGDGKASMLHIWPYWSGPCQQWKLEEQG